MMCRKRRGLIALAVLFFGVSLTLSQRSQPAQAPATPPSATVQRVFGEGQFTEGPAVATDGSVYFSDLTFVDEWRHEAGHIWKFDPRTGKTTVFRSPSGMSNGIEFDRTGRMIVAEGDDGGGRRITRTDMHTGKSTVLASAFDGQPLNSPNDLTIDSAGRIYFSDPRYGDVTSVRQPVMGVYRIDTNRTVVRIISDVPMPNGLAISPDQQTLYVGCFDEGTETTTQPTTRGRPRQMAVYAFDLSRDGEASNKRVVIDFGAKDGPDGMTVDDRGRLYVAVRDERRAGIGVYSSQGKELLFITMPEVPSNLTFDRGSQWRRLYVTAGGSLYRVTLHGSLVGKP